MIQATVRNLGAGFVILSQARILVDVAPESPSEPKFVREQGARNGADGLGLDTLVTFLW
jgi:hypothetical protein